MTVGRNDPCPCGSGRKYKACCMNAERIAERAFRLLGEDAAPEDAGEWREAASGAEFWEADVAPLGMRRVDAAAPALLLVATGEVVVHAEVLAQRPTTAAECAREIARAVTAAGSAAGALPARVHVRDPEVAEALGAELGRRGVFPAAAPLPQLDALLAEAVAHLGAGGPGAYTAFLESWRETGASPAELAAFHAAAAAFHRVAPWRALPNDELFSLALPGGGEWAASVMGDAGIEQGVALYSDPGDLLALFAERQGPEEHFAGMRGMALSVSFEPRGNLPRTMQREVTAAGWEIARPNAYPVIIGLHLPGGRFAAEHVRIATLALRALTLLARKEDPEPETGVRVSVLELEGDDECDHGPPWDLPERAEPICAEGPGADPEGALRGWDDHEEVERTEGERLRRMEAWLRDQALSKPALEADLRNARHWMEFLEFHALPAGAVTEFDLRVFLYDFYPRKANATKAAAHELPGSLARIFRFLEEQEGIRYPFAARALEELEEVAQVADEEKKPLDDLLDELHEELYPYLDARRMLHDRSIPGVASGWPAFMDMDVALLERELERRWLLWYDEAVRRGVVDPDALEQVLVGRQREWENTPHPAHAGRTPADVVRAYRPPFVGR
ncbi:MAG TPA: SEC-C domain-containing protein [Longimicrobium sp.]|jgi:hypothetical protein